MPRVTPIKRSLFEKFLKFVGCEFKRKKGSHIIYSRIGLKRPVVFPEDKEVSPYIIRSNLRTLGITVEEYLEILKRL